jgi:hypothetical protein
MEAVSEDLRRSLRDVPVWARRQQHLPAIVLPFRT